MAKSSPYWLELTFKLSVVAALWIEGPAPTLGECFAEGPCDEVDSVILLSVPS